MKQDKYNDLKAVNIWSQYSDHFRSRADFACFIIEYVSLSRFSAVLLTEGTFSSPEMAIRPERFLSCSQMTTLLKQLVLRTFHGRSFLRGGISNSLGTEAMAKLISNQPRVAYETYSCMLTSICDGEVHWAPTFLASCEARMN